MHTRKSVFKYTVLYLDKPKTACNFACITPIYTTMIDIKRNITFEAEKRKKDGQLIEENVPIRCVITYCGQRLTLFSGHRINLGKFLPDKQKVKNGCTNKAGETSSEINAALDTMRSLLQDIFRDYASQDTIPTPDQLKEAYRTKIKKPFTSTTASPLSFFDRYTEFMTTVGQNNAWTMETKKKHQVIYNIVREWNPSICFDDLTETNLLAFIDFCRNKRELRNTTLAKHLAFLKQFLNWAVKKGYHTNTAFQGFKPKLKGAHFDFKKVIYLTWDELMQVYNLEIPADKQYLRPSRDVFCFCCFTGLRYSDVYKLKKSDIHNGKIDIVTQKDVDHISIELNKYSASILDKYKDLDLKNNKALPVPVNQRYNLYLKEIGQLAKLNEKITEVWYEGNLRKEETFFKYERLTTHVARKTFVVNALTLGIPATVIMRWTGHSDLKAMKPYMKIVDKLKEEEMDKFNQL